VSLVNFTMREITCKIVYYGPGRSGKTTNLHYIYGRVPDARRGRMVSLATQTDRTLFFDFLPIDLGQISGFTTRFQLYTVPGQVYYNATRRLVLQGADGVVFVADSQARQLDENLESLQNLQSNLLEHGVDIRTVPLVMQYNKQDLPRELILSGADLDDALNFRGVPSFSADALHGQGVFETLKGISELVLKKLGDALQGLEHPLIPSTRSIRSWWGRRTASPSPRGARWPRTPARRTTRCSSTAAPGWARRTCSWPSVMRRRRRRRR